MRKKQNKRGFTLVELMVVAVIVAILAAVAIPLMSANKKRAMATEAESGLGTIRTALRAMYAETSDYSRNSNSNQVSNIGDISGLNTNDLNGRWFDSSCYTFDTGPAQTTYKIKATGGGGLAPRHADVSGIIITLDETGAFVRTGL